MKRLTRGQAIKAKCLDCCVDSTTSVRCCQSLGCPLWDYRFGETPKVRAGRDYRVLLDRDFFLAHWGMPEIEFNQLVLAEAVRRCKKAKSA